VEFEDNDLEKKSDKRSDHTLLRDDLKSSSKSSPSVIDFLEYPLIGKNMSIHKSCNNPQRRRKMIGVHLDKIRDDRTQRRNEISISDSDESKEDIPSDVIPPNPE